MGRITLNDAEIEHASTTQKEQFEPNGFNCSFYLSDVL